MPIEISTSKRSFLKTWAYSVIVLGVLMAVFFAFIGSFEDGFWDGLIGVVILAVLIGTIFALGIKWHKQGYKFEGLANGNLNKKDEQSVLELKNQIENYKKLKITQSSRGQVVLFFGGVFLLSFILISSFDLEGIMGLEDLFLGLLVYIPILIFVYKGHRWAMILLMVLWTLEKIYTAYLSTQAGGSAISSIIWLVIGWTFIYRALNVEFERRNIKNTKDHKVEMESRS